MDMIWKTKRQPCLREEAGEAPLVELATAWGQGDDFLQGLPAKICTPITFSVDVFHLCIPLLSDLIDCTSPSRCRGIAQSFLRNFSAMRLSGSSFTWVRPKSQQSDKPAAPVSIVISHKSPWTAMGLVYNNRVWLLS